MKFKRTAALLLTLALLAGYVFMPCSAPFFEELTVDARAETVLPVSGQSNNVFWEIDENGCLTISGTGDWENSSLGMFPPWHDYCSLIKSAAVKLSETTDASLMFAYSYNLTFVDLSGFDTSNVKRMYSMFHFCHRLKYVDTRGLNTSNVEDMAQMFYECKELTDINLSGFDTRNVTDMGSMFSGCSSLTVLDVKNFDTSKVKNMSDMFGNCKSLTALYVYNFNTKNVTNIGSMFYGCSSITYLDLSGFELTSLDAKNSYSTSYVFEDCDELATIITPKSIASGVKIPLPCTFCESYSNKEYTELYTSNAGKTLRKKQTILQFQKSIINITWNDSLFSDGAFTYNNDLAIAALTLSAAAEYSQSRLNTCLKQMEFDTGSIEFHYNASPAYTFAQKKIEIDGETKTLISVVIRGTTIDENMGDIVPDFLQSYDDKAQEVEKALSKYISSNCSSVDNDDLLFFITGHSLGGAVASTLDQELYNKYSSDKLFVYSFAPPKYYSKYKGKIKNVFEICNDYDIVPYYGGMGTTQSGVRKSFDGRKDELYGYYYRLLTNSERKIPSPIMPNFDHHDVNIYMSYLMSKADNVAVETKPYSIRVIIIRCPVDVEVFNAGQELICKVKNNVIDESVSSDNAFCLLDDDQKYIFVGSDTDITVKLSATDTGTMEYSVQKLTAPNEEVSEEDIKTFEAVQLTEGKEFISEINADDETVEDVRLFVVDAETKLPQKEIDTDGSENELSAFSISGKAISFDEGGITVKLLDKNGAPVKTTVCEDSYSFENISDGTYTLVVSKSKHCTREYEITVNGKSVKADIAIAKYGDIDGDGSITIRDALQIVNYRNSKSSKFDGLEDDELKYLEKLADINDDSKVNITDALQIVNFRNGKKSAFDDVA